MKVVLDTNVIVSAYIAPSGPPAIILRLAEARAYDLVASRAILSEYERVLGYPHVRSLHRKTDVEISTIVGRLAKVAERITPTERIAVIEEDPDDDKFIECAVEAGADYIVSGNKHLLKLGAFRGIQILPPALFLRLFDNAETTP
ncbi:MAG: putative toxin-antitoxin system toxin component, PIN family [Thermomicrobiales bacterium]